MSTERVLSLNLSFRMRCQIYDRCPLLGYDPLGMDMFEYSTKLRNDIEAHGLGVWYGNEPH